MSGDYSRLSLALEELPLTPIGMRSPKLSHKKKVTKHYVAQNKLSRRRLKPLQEECNGIPPPSEMPENDEFLLPQNLQHVNTRRRMVKHGKENSQMPRNNTRITEPPKSGPNFQMGNVITHLNKERRDSLFSDIDDGSFIEFSHNPVVDKSILSRDLFPQFYYTCSEDNETKYSTSSKTNLAPVGFHKLMSAIKSSKDKLGVITEDSSCNEKPERENKIYFNESVVACSRDILALKTGQGSLHGALNSTECTPEHKVPFPALNVSTLTSVDMMKGKEQSNLYLYESVNVIDNTEVLPDVGNCLNQNNIKQHSYTHNKMPMENKWLTSHEVRNDNKTPLLESSLYTEDVSVLSSIQDIPNTDEEDLEHEKIDKEEIKQVIYTSDVEDRVSNWVITSPFKDSSFGTSFINGKGERGRIHQASSKSPLTKSYNISSQTDASSPLRLSNGEGCSKGSGNTIFTLERVAQYKKNATDTSINLSTSSSHEVSDTLSNEALKTRSSVDKSASDNNLKSERYCFHNSTITPKTNLTASEIRKEKKETAYCKLSDSPIIIYDSDNSDDILSDTFQSEKLQSAGINEYEEKIKFDLMTNNISTKLATPSMNKYNEKLHTQNFNYVKSSDCSVKLSPHINVEQYNKRSKSNLNNVEVIDTSAICISSCEDSPLYSARNEDSTKIRTAASSLLRLHITSDDSANPDERSSRHLTFEKSPLFKGKKSTIRKSKSFSYLNSPKEVLLPDVSSDDSPLGKLCSKSLSLKELPHFSLSSDSEEENKFAKLKKEFYKVTNNIQDGCEIKCHVSASDSSDDEVGRYQNPNQSIGVKKKSYLPNQPSDDKRLSNNNDDLSILLYSPSSKGAKKSTEVSPPSPIQKSKNRNAIRVLLSTSSDSEDENLLCRKINKTPKLQTPKQTPVSDLSILLYSPMSKEAKNSTEVSPPSPIQKSKNRNTIRVLLSSSSDSEDENLLFRKIKKTPKFKTPKRTPVSVVKKTTNQNLITPKRSDNQLSLLASLTLDTPVSKAHVTAIPFIKNFNKQKDALIEKLYSLFNTHVFSNQLPPSMKISWNSRMTKTAGFCYYQMDKSKEKGRGARIELSSKVIDAPERLRDTLIHELCHAASWIVSGYKDGHGPLWKSWANKAMTVFPELPEIRRCHSYEINFKYTYKCTNCGYSIGRHSKSLNTESQVCGYCYGKFELLVNYQRGRGSKKAEGCTPQPKSTPRTPSGFALFVKNNYGSVKKTQTGLKHKDVMKTLSEEFAKLKTTSYRNDGI